MPDELRLTERAAQRLRDDAVGWFTTVRPDAQPQSSLVWFWWHDTTVWIRSQPHAAKVRNVERAQRIALNLNSDEHGNDMVTLEGSATVVDDLPGSVRGPYLQKYDRQIRSDLGTTPEDFLADYSTTIRVEITRVRVW